MSSPSPKTRMRAAERIAEELTRRITSGQYAPHTYLPPERVLAVEFSASPTTVSTALMQMAEKGLVVQTRGRGTRVLPPLDRLSNKVAGIVRMLSTGSGTQFLNEGLFMITGMHEMLTRLGHRAEIVTVPSNGTLAPLTERFGGLIFVETCNREQELLKLAERKFPFVVANLEVDIPVAATCVDHRAVMRRAVEVLAGFGHRRIAFLGRDPDEVFYGRARQGYLDGLRDMGVAPDEGLIVASAETDALSGYLAAKPLFERKDRPTALVAARDILAQGACRAIAEAGLTAGREVSVIGYDDVTWPQEEPFLTTFHEPCREMGEVAAQMLADLVVNGWRPPERRILDAPLLLRRSAGPIW